MQEDMPQEMPSISNEQRIYARVLRMGVGLCLVLLASTFLTYVLELRKANIPPNEVPRYWSMSSKQFVHAMGIPTGWAWTDKLGSADFQTNMGVCVLAALSGVAYMHVLPGFFRRRNYPTLVIIAAELAVMALAASGAVSSGH